MKKNYYRITMEGSGQQLICEYENLAEYLMSDLEAANPGTKLTVEIVEMDEKEYEEMGEFEGW